MANHERSHMEHTEEKEKLLPETTPKLLLLYLLWLSSISVLFLLQISDVFPRKIIPPENVHFVTVEAQLVFLLVAWPLFLNHLQTLFTTHQRQDSREIQPFSVKDQKIWWTGFMTHAFALIAFSFPLVFLAADVSQTSWKTVLLFQSLVITLIVSLGIFWCLAGRLYSKWLQPYYFLSILFALGAPALHVLLKQVSGQTVDFLLILSPISVIFHYHNTGTVFSILTLELLLIAGGGTAAGLVYLFHPNSVPKKIPSKFS